jgi:glycosyltransferase involved in cell wall biosynthesis
MSERPARIRIALLGDARQVHVHRWAGFLVDSGHDVLTLSLEPVDLVAGARRRIDLPRFLPDFLRYPLSVPVVRSILERFRPDVVNAHFLPNYGVIAALVGRSPWVLSTWGSDIMVLPQKSAFHMARTRFVIRRADYLTSDADVMTRRLVDLGARRDRILTFPFGVDRRSFFPAPAVARNGIRIICNRKMEDLYNIESVIDAFVEVVATLPGARLVLAGSGSKRPALERRARESAAASAISFAGDVPHENMPDLLRENDIFVSVALSDTTSVSLLEAMACGLFPVVSDLPASREWIEDGVNGFVVTARDAASLARAIRAAAGNAELRSSARDKNAGLIEARADWHRNMSVVDDLFRRLAAAS